MFLLSTVAPDAIRETARKVLSEPHFQTTPSESADLLSMLIRFLTWILEPLLYVFNLLSGVSTVFAYMVFGIVITTFVVLLFLFLSRLANLKRLSPIAVDQSMATEKRDAAHLESLANDSLQSHDYVIAVRLYLMATLARLEQAHETRFRPGMTNREHLRRYARSSIFEPMRFIVDLMDRTWYGAEKCDNESASKCRDAYYEIMTQIKRRAHVDGA